MKRTPPSAPVARASALSLLLALLLSACGAEDAPPPTLAEAGYLLMQPQSVPLMVELAGRTSAFEVSEVRPQVSGIVKARLFAEGSIVRAGETLYQIDSSLYRAGADQARANLANAEAVRAAAQARANRYKPLAEMEAVSKQDYDEAVASAKQATAAVAQNRAQLETASINLQFTRVSAPITGRIGRAQVTTGALVTAGQADALTTIQRLDPIYVDIQQSSADLLKLRRALAGGSGRSSTPVRLTLEDGSEYPQVGVLQFAEPVVDERTGTVTLRARFPNPENLLLPGMYVRAHLSQMTATSAYLVPQVGLTHNARGDATVMVIGPQDKAVSRIVTTRQTMGTNWLVTGGLKPGDRVIVNGLIRIKEGDTVKPIQVSNTVSKTPQTAPARAGTR